MADINVGQISEALNDKADRDLQNLDTVGGADAVIEYQIPTSENNYTWYRKYASGWIEQGGFFTTTAARYIEQTISLVKPMVDNKYNCSASVIANSNVVGGAKISNTITTTQFTVLLSCYENSASNLGCYWEVKGIGAQ